MSSSTTPVSTVCEFFVASRSNRGSARFAPSHSSKCRRNGVMRHSLAIVGGALLVGALASHAAEVASGTAPSAAATSFGGTHDRCAALSDLMKGKWPDSTTRILESAWQPLGAQVKTMMGPVGPLPEHCELTAVMHERIGSDGQHYAIRWHLRLPGNWNGRFFFEGGGGTEGELGAAIGFIGIGG